jgi:excisionase family DNA binding protein
MPEFLTVPELATLLRIKERKVYDLAASGDVPCSRVTGKLLFPERAVRDWIAAGSGGTAAGAARPAVFLGSHDPLLEWALRQSRCGLATYFDGSLDGLHRFAAGEGVAAGLHLRDADGGWNRAGVAEACGGQAAVLVGFARRARGLVLPPGNPAGVAGLADLAGRRLVPRQPESGTDRLFRQSAAAAGLDLATVELTPAARSENDAVMAVAQEQADATFGLQALAAAYGLAFLPVVEEAFDLLIDRRAYFEPPMQALLRFLQGPEFRNGAEGFAGYDLSALGEVRWNG